MRRRTSRFRVERLTFWVAAAAVVLISIAVQLQSGAADALADLPRFSGSSVVAEMPSILPAARLPSRLRVAIVRDPAAASFYNSPSVLDSIVQVWRSELAAIGADARVVSPSTARTRDAQVIVIPSSPCMTVATREVIETATANGQGLIVTGLAGVYDAGCRWIGYGLIVGLTGVTRAEMIEPRGMVYVVLPAGSPLAADVPPGARIELSPANQVAVRHRGRAAYYSDYALQPQPASGKPLLDGAIVHAARGRSRVVYLGFELNNVVPRAWNASMTRLLVRNSVAWAGRQTLGWVEHWPEGRRSAAVFAQDVEAQFSNARFALDSLRAAGVPGTFYLTSRLASRYKRLTRDLAAGGEVGTHSENHRRLGGATEEVQRSRLKETQKELTRLLGSPVAGLRPPEEQFDTATMRAWLAAGGRYLFGVNDARAAAPELLRVGGDTLVLIGRIGGDDFAVAGRGVTRDPGMMTTLFLNELNQARALGGLYLFSYHSQLLARPEHVPVLARVARTIAADSSVWAATTGEVAAWWRDRAGLRLETRARGPNALDVIVKNRGSRIVGGAVVHIVTNDRRRGTRANARLLPSEAGVLRIVLPPIPSGATRSYTVRFDDGDVRPRATTTLRGRAVRQPAPWWQFWKRN